MKTLVSITTRMYISYCAYFCIYVFLGNIPVFLPWTG